LGTRSSDNLQLAFEARLDYEIKNNGFNRSNSIFNIKIKELLGSFIKSWRDECTIYYGFFNPSITDFLMDYFNENKEEKWRIFDSAIYTEQYLTILDGPFKKIKLTIGENNRLFLTISKKESILKSLIFGSREFELIKIYCSLCDIATSKNNIIKQINAIKWYEISILQFSPLIKVLNKLSEYTWAKNEIIKYWTEIVDCLFDKALAKDDFENIMDLFYKFNQDYFSYIENDGCRDVVRDRLNKYWATKINNIQSGIDEEENYCTEKGLNNYLEKLMIEATEFNMAFGINNIEALNDISEMDVEEIAAENYKRAKEEDNLQDQWKEDYYSKNEDNQKIDALFEKN